MITTLCIISCICVFYKPVTNYIIGYEDFNIAVVFALGIIAQLIFRYAQLVIRMQQKGNLYSLLQIFQKLFNLLFILDRKSTRLNSSHVSISYAVFCLKK